MFSDPFLKQLDANLQSKNYTLFDYSPRNEVYLVKCNKCDLRTWHEKNVIDKIVNGSLVCFHRGTSKENDSSLDFLNSHLEHRGFQIIKEDQTNNQYLVKCLECSQEDWYIRKGIDWLIDGSIQCEHLTLPVHKTITDNVNHPKHYTSHPSGVECIQITRHMGFNLGNAIKYIWRADLKNDEIEDIKKAMWYLQDEVNKRESKKNN